MKLKPCPFCGSEPRILVRKKHICKYGIGCTNMDCIAWLPSDVDLEHLHSYTTAYRYKKDMLEAWNKRIHDGGLG